MATEAESIHMGVYALPPFEPRCQGNKHGVNEDLSFQFDFWNDFQTLSKYRDQEEDFDGALYVPQLAQGDACNEDAEPYIPSNVTRLSDLPENDCRLISLAPWVSAECTKQFLAQAIEDEVSAAIFYLPGDTSSSVPSTEDRAWYLDDGGAWRTESNFPIYAIPGPRAMELTDMLARYSGNMSDAPHGDELSRIYGTGFDVRVFASVHLESNDQSTDLPRLWVFLLVLLAILISGVVLSAVVTRVVQRRRRQSLQRRIAEGQVDLEMLRIKRINVPQQVLDKMPLYTYDGAPQPSAEPATRAVSSPAPPGEDASTAPEAQDKDSAVAGASNPPPDSESQSSSKAEPSQAVASTNSGHHDPTTLSQPTCPICLDDYVSGESTVRELPCRHIFHPECIDSFLLRNSSLCPVCKTTVLPTGFCPDEVTDAMVRQERLATRMRQQREALEQRAAARRSQTTRRSSQAPTQFSMRRLSTRVRNLSLSAGGWYGDRRNSATAQTPGGQGTLSTERREQMRRRAVAMLGDEQTAEDVERERDASTPRWRRVLRRGIPFMR